MSVCSSLHALIRVVPRAIVSIYLEMMAFLVHKNILILKNQQSKIDMLIILRRKIINGKKGPRICKRYYKHG